MTTISNGESGASVRAKLNASLAITDDALVSSNNLSEVANAATSFDNIKQAATTSKTGVLRNASWDSNASEIDIYILFGQSNSNGQALVSNYDAKYTAARSDIFIYDPSGLDVEAYDVGINHTLGTDGVLTNAGHDPILAYELDEIGRRICFVRASASGTALEDYWSVGNTGYINLTTRLDGVVVALKALGYTRINFRAAIYAQGERDGSTTGGYSPATNYENDLNAVIAGVRSTTDNPNLPVVIVEPKIGPTQVANYSKIGDVQTAQAAVAAADDLVFLMDTAAAGYSQSDDLHFDYDGQKLIGETAMSLIEATAPLIGIKFSTAGEAIEAVRRDTAMPPLRVKESIDHTLSMTPRRELTMSEGTSDNSANTGVGTSGFDGLSYWLLNTQGGVLADNYVALRTGARLGLQSSTGTSADYDKVKLTTGNDPFTVEIILTRSSTYHDFQVGLSGSAAPAVPTTAAFFGFRYEEASSTWYAIFHNGTGETQKQAVSTVTDGVFRFMVSYDGASLFWHLNGTLVHSCETESVNIASYIVAKIKAVTPSQSSFNNVLSIRTS